MALSHIVIGTIILAILSIVLASAWNSFINLLIEYYFPSIRTEIISGTIYIVTLTLIVVLAAGYFIPKFDTEYNKASDEKKIIHGDPSRDNVEFISRL